MLFCCVKWSACFHFHKTPYNHNIMHTWHSSHSIIITIVIKIACCCTWCSKLTTWIHSVRGKKCEILNTTRQLARPFNTLSNHTTRPCCYSSKKQHDSTFLASISSKLHAYRHIFKIAMVVNWNLYCRHDNRFSCNLKLTWCNILSSYSLTTNHHHHSNTSWVCYMGSCPI